MEQFHSLFPSFLFNQPRYEAGSHLRVFITCYHLALLLFSGVKERYCSLSSLIFNRDTPKTVYTILRVFCGLTLLNAFPVSLNVVKMTNKTSEIKLQPALIGKIVHCFFVNTVLRYHPCSIISFVLEVNDITLNDWSRREQ